jgi:hypothetical protein
VNESGVHGRQRTVFWAEADAREAAVHGWHPRYQHWSASILRVTYVREVAPLTRAQVHSDRRSALRLFR